MTTDSDRTRPVTAHFVETHEAELRVVNFRLAIDDETVPGTAWMMADLDDLAPLVLLQHPLTGSREDFFVAETGRAWAMRGWICAGIDAPLHGDRDVFDPFALMADRTSYPAIARRFAGEVTATIDALAERYPVDAARIGYVGYSLGAALGVGAVALDGRFRAAALCLVGEGGLAGPAQGVESFAAGLSGTAVRLVGRTRDEIIPREATVALFDAITGVRDLLWLPGSHFDIGPDVVEAASQWMKQHLDDAPHPGFRRDP